MDSYDLIFKVAFFVIYGLAGLCLGSFATAVIHRELNEQPWAHYKGHLSRSACPHCNLSLGVKDLVPVFSWLYLRGKCRNCAAAIPLFYPFIEVLCFTCAILIYVWSGVSVISITAMVCLPFIVSLIYLGLVHKNFSWRLVIILSIIGLSAFFVQILSFN